MATRSRFVDERRESRDRRSDTKRAFIENENDKDEATTGSSKPASVVVKKPRIGELDEKNKLRSRRMFGVIVGTLKEIVNTKKTDADVKREEIDAKTQERLEREQQEIAQKITKEKEERILLRTQARKQSEQQQIKLLSQHWRKHHILVSAFLQTEAKPSLRYLPKKLLESEVAQIASQQAEVQQKFAEVVEEKHVAVFITQEELAQEEAEMDAEDEEAGHESTNQSNDNGSTTATEQPSQKEKGKDDDEDAAVDYEMDT